MVNITQDMYSVTKQAHRSVYIKINLLNSSYQIVDEISGNVEGGNVNIDADADIRRTCNVNMVVTDSSFNIGEGGKIWIDKFIQIYIGIKNISTGNIVWFNQGIYIIDDPSWDYDASTNSLSFQGLDLMANLTGDRRGVVPRIPTVIAQGTNIRDAILTLLQLCGVSKYIVEENSQLTPIEIKSDLGDSIYDLLSKLRNITPNWQIYFDINGVFHYEPIPNGEDDPIMIDDDVWDYVKIKESVKVPFSDVKNIVEVWGQSINTSRYGVATVSGSTYVVTMDDVHTYYNGTKYGVTVPSAISNPSLNINSIGAKAIINEDGTPAIIPEANEYYVFQYDSDKDKFIFLGYQQVHAIAQDNNPNSPYYVNGSAGVLRKILHGGDYNDIITKPLCQERANWELYLSVNRQDGLDLEVVPVYYLDVNILSSYTNKNKETNTYMIKSISTDLSAIGTQSVDMIRFYPNYPYY